MPRSEGQLRILPKKCESSVSLDRARNGTHIFYGWGGDRSFASAPAWPESAQTDVNALWPLPHSHADSCLLQTAVELSASLSPCSSRRLPNFCLRVHSVVTDVNGVVFGCKSRADRLQSK